MLIIHACESLEKPDETCLFEMVVGRERRHKVGLHESKAGTTDQAPTLVCVRSEQIPRVGINVCIDVNYLYPRG
jgi:hypothetical protein